MHSGIFAIFIFLAETGFVKNPAETSIEPTLINLVSWFELLIEMLGALIPAIGVGVAVYEFILVLFDSSAKNYNRVRLSFARYLVLEFQLTPVFSPPPSKKRSTTRELTFRIRTAFCLINRTIRFALKTGIRETAEKKAEKKRKRKKPKS
ncbi:MAG TPA: hypothetical protein VK892_15085 [Pyrinomonadaceae bacterium]|nr:hypothetical protein [Pyrinomonadaceae bacterium]